MTSKVVKKFSKIFSIDRVFLCNSRNFSKTMTENLSAVSPNHMENINKIKEFIPKLTATLHKGECGRIGIIGGSAEYTGAPYFAAISALKTGADLVYVFCHQAAASVIKSYSPELIVNPILDSDDIINKIEPWLHKLHVLVIGPGLGRQQGIFENVKKIINYCKKNQPCLPLVIDADGLYLINENISLIEDYKGPIILTPNSVELDRLQLKLKTSDIFLMASKLNVVIVQKGSTDNIINGIYNTDKKYALTCDVDGSFRRCGGQGDILAGCLATFVSWFRFSRSTNFPTDFSNEQIDDPKMFVEKFLGYSLAAYAACTLTRTCSNLAFRQNKRSMTASDMISFINKAFEINFEQ